MLKEQFIEKMEAIKEIKDYSLTEIDSRDELQNENV